MEVIGQLTGRIAHDFNKLLTPIVSARDLLQRRSLGAGWMRRRSHGRPSRFSRPRACKGTGLSLSMVCGLASQLGGALIIHNTPGGSATACASRPTAEYYRDGSPEAGMWGNRAGQTIQNKRPSAKVLIVSGYAETAGITPSLPRLNKPFRDADLAASLDALFTIQQPDTYKSLLEVGRTFSV